MSGVGGAITIALCGNQKFRTLLFFWPREGVSVSGMLSQMAVVRLLVAGIGAVIGVTLLISWARSEGATATPRPTAQGSAAASFWDTFGKAEVFVLTIPATMNRWRHLRDVISTGPWPATLVEGCTPQTPEVAAALAGKQLQEKAVALVCSHVRAVEMAKAKNLGARGAFELCWSPLTCLVSWQTLR